MHVWDKKIKLITIISHSQIGIFVEHICFRILIVVLVPSTLSKWCQSIRTAFKNGIRADVTKCDTTPNKMSGDQLHTILK